MMRVEQATLGASYGVFAGRGRCSLTQLFQARHYSVESVHEMKNGFCLLPKFFSKQQVADFRANIQEHAKRLQSQADLQVFDDGEDQAHGDQEDFLASGDKVIAMFQPGKERKVFKLGHGLHVVDPLWQQLAESDSVKQVAARVGYQDHVVVQSQALLKEAGSAEVSAHQDSSFLITKPDTLCALWIALDPATVKNGCLWVVPGRQQITRYYERGPEGKLGFRNTVQDPSFDMRIALPLPCEPGDAVAFLGDVVHFSPPNTSEDSRWAITLHFASASSAWAKENWLHCQHLTERMA